MSSYDDDDDHLIAIPNVMWVTDAAADDKFRSNNTIAALVFFVGERKGVVVCMRE